MKPVQSESISEFSHLKSNDEKVFYYLVVNYFFERAKEYYGRYTVFFFSGDQGVFEITSKCSFDNENDLNRFHQNLGRRNYHFILSQDGNGFWKHSKGHLL